MADTHAVGDEAMSRWPMVALKGHISAQKAAGKSARATLTSGLRSRWLGARGLGISSGRGGLGAGDADGGHHDGEGGAIARNLQRAAGSFVVCSGSALQDSNRSLD